MVNFCLFALFHSQFSMISTQAHNAYVQKMHVACTICGRYECVYNIWRQEQLFTLLICCCCCFFNFRKIRSGDVWLVCMYRWHVCKLCTSPTILEMNVDLGVEQKNHQLFQMLVCSMCCATEGELCIVGVIWVWVYRARFNW